MLALRLIIAFLSSFSYVYLQTLTEAAFSKQKSVLSVMAVMSLEDLNTFSSSV